MTRATPSAPGEACDASQATMALSTRMVDCVAPKRPPLHAESTNSIARAHCAENDGARSHARIASDVVSSTRLSPPERVIEVFAPRSAPSSPCFSARRCIAAVAASSPTSRSTFAASARMYGSVLSRESVRTRATSASMPCTRDCESAQVMYASVTSCGAPPKVSSESELRTKPPLPSRFERSHWRVRSSIAPSTAKTFAMSVNSITP